MRTSSSSVTDRPWSPQAHPHAVGAVGHDAARVVAPVPEQPRRPGPRGTRRLRESRRTTFAVLVEDRDADVVGALEADPDPGLPARRPFGEKTLGRAQRLDEPRGLLEALGDEERAEASPRQATAKAHGRRGSQGRTTSDVRHLPVVERVEAAGVVAAAHDADRAAVADDQRGKRPGRRGRRRARRARGPAARANDSPPGKRNVRVGAAPGRVQLGILARDVAQQRPSSRRGRPRAKRGRR